MGRLIVDDKERVGAYVASMVGHVGSWGEFFAIGAEDSSGELVAGIVFNNYNHANATSHIAVGKPTKELIPLFRAASHYAFVQCGLKRLTGMVPLSEPATIAFDKHIGYEEEFIMKDAAPDGDMMVLVLWPHNCRWLQED